jgi:hypothetical protein
LGSFPPIRDDTNQGGGVLDRSTTLRSGFAQPPRQSVVITHGVSDPFARLLAERAGYTVECKDASMSRIRGGEAHQLKIYRGPGKSAAPTLANRENAAPRITVSIGEVLPLLAEAVASQRTWLQDFEDDDITISADLYEVLLAYQYYRRPSA